MLSPAKEKKYERKLVHMIYTECHIIAMMANIGDVQTLRARKVLVKLFL